MKKVVWVLFSFMLVVVDQLSKYWMLIFLTPYQSKALFPGFNLTLAFNKGVAFSMLSTAGDWNRWFFVAFSLLMSIVLLVWLIKTPSSNRTQCGALTLILGGALGNLYDRLFLGYVVDFLDVYYRNYHWPIFNLADSFICIGVALLLASSYKNKTL